MPDVRIRATHEVIEHPSVVYQCRRNPALAGFVHRRRASTPLIDVIFAMLDMPRPHHDRRMPCHRTGNVVNEVLTAIAPRRLDRFGNKEHLGHQKACSAAVSCCPKARCRQEMPIVSRSAKAVTMGAMDAMDPFEDEYDDEEADEGSDERRKRWSEGPLKDAVRRAIEKSVETGIGTFTKADSAVRTVFDDGKLPKEMIGYVFSSVDETKNAMVRGVAKEVRDFLEATDIAQEFYKVLTTLSFEVKTEIRFIPNEKGGIRPDV